MSVESQEISPTIQSRDKTVGIHATDLSLGDSVRGKFNTGEYDTVWSQNEIPMLEIPLSNEWRESLRTDDLRTAEHELGHAFVAYKMGIGVRHASIVPNPSKGYRGITILETPGSHQMNDMMIVSAAGSSRSFDGNRSDQMTHETISAQYSGRDFGSSLAQAKSIINSITLDEWRIMTQIFAYKREITGNDIPEMLRRARYELHHGMTPDEKMFAETVRTVHKSIYTADVVGIIEDQVIEEELGDGTIKRYIKRNGQMQESTVEIFCASCGMKGGHTADCRSSKKLPESSTIFESKMIN